MLLEARKRDVLFRDSSSRIRRSKSSFKMDKEPRPSDEAIYSKILFWVLSRRWLMHELMLMEMMEHTAVQTDG